MSDLTRELVSSIERFVFHFNAARKKARLFPSTHATVAEVIAKLKDSIDAIHRERASFSLAIANGEIFFDRHLLPNESLVYGALIGDLSYLGLTSFAVQRGLDFAELTAFVGATTRKRDDIVAEGGWQEVFRKNAIDHISLVHVMVRNEAPRSDHAEEEQRAYGLHRAALEAVRTTFEDAQKARRFDVNMIDGVIKLLVNAAMDKVEILNRLTAIKNIDQYTFYHSVNVAMLSLLIGIRLKFPVALLNRLGTAAMLHDVGKTCVPEDIIKKPGGLNDEEWRIMQSHPVEGAKILAGQSQLDPLSLIVAAQHHVRYDMSGYPAGDGTPSQHLMSGIVAVADTYDALTSNRAYRKAMLPDHAMQLVIDGGGTHFHPEIVKVFANLTGLFPVGTVVRLTTGDLGVVCKANPKDLCRPVVRLVSGEGPDAVGGSLVDLTQKTGARYLRSIDVSVDPADHGLVVSRFVEPLN